MGVDVAVGLLMMRRSAYGSACVPRRFAHKLTGSASRVAR